MLNTDVGNRDSDESEPKAKSANRTSPIVAPWCLWTDDIVKVTPNRYFSKNPDCPKDLKLETSSFAETFPLTIGSSRNRDYQAQCCILLDAETIVTSDALTQHGHLISQYAHEARIADSTTVASVGAFIRDGKISIRIEDCKERFEDTIRIVLANVGNDLSRITFEDPYKDNHLDLIRQAGLLSCITPPRSMTDQSAKAIISGSVQKQSSGLELYYCRKLGVRLVTNGVIQNLIDDIDTPNFQKQLEELHYLLNTPRRQTPERKEAQFLVVDHTFRTPITDPSRFVMNSFNSDLVECFNKVFQLFQSLGGNIDDPSVKKQIKSALQAFHVYYKNQNIPLFKMELPGQLRETRNFPNTQWNTAMARIVDQQPEKSALLDIGNDFSPSNNFKPQPLGKLVDGKLEYWKEASPDDIALVNMLKEKYFGDGSEMIEPPTVYRFGVRPLRSGAIVRKFGDPDAGRRMVAFKMRDKDGNIVEQEFIVSDLPYQKPDWQKFLDQLPEDSPHKKVTAAIYEKIMAKFIEGRSRILAKLKELFEDDYFPDGKIAHEYSYLEGEDGTDEISKVVLVREAVPGRRAKDVNLYKMSIEDVANLTNLIPGLAVATVVINRCSLGDGDMTITEIRDGRPIKICIPEIRQSCSPSLDPLNRATTTRHPGISIARRKHEAMHGLSHATREDAEKLSDSYWESYKALAYRAKALLSADSDTRKELDKIIDEVRKEMQQVLEPYNATLEDLPEELNLPSEVTKTFDQYVETNVELQITQGKNLEQKSLELLELASQGLQNPDELKAVSDEVSSFLHMNAAQNKIIRSVVSRYKAASDKLQNITCEERTALLQHARISSWMKQSGEQGTKYIAKIAQSSSTLEAFKVRMKHLTHCVLHPDEQEIYYDAQQVIQYSSIPKSIQKAFALEGTPLAS